jgi:hypothetical protein
MPRSAWPLPTISTTASTLLELRSKRSFTPSSPAIACASSMSIPLITPSFCT